MYQRFYNSVRDNSLTPKQKEIDFGRASIARRSATSAVATVVRVMRKGLCAAAVCGRTLPVRPQRHRSQ